MTTTHTPAPFYIKQYVDCKTPYVSICRENPAYAFGVSKGEEIICNVENAEHAAFIVKAVNLHDELVSLLEEVFTKDQREMRGNLANRARAALAKAGAV